MDDLFFLRDAGEADIAMISAIRSENKNIAHFEFKYRSVSRIHKINHRTMSKLCEFFTNYINETKNTNSSYDNASKSPTLSRKFYLILARIVFPRYAYNFYSTISCEDTEYDDFCTFDVVAEENDRKHLSITYLRDEAIAVELLDDDSCMDFVDFFRRFDPQDPIRS